MFLFVAWMVATAPRERAVMIYPRERVWFRRAFYNRHQHELQHELQKRYAVEVHDHVADFNAGAFRRAGDVLDHDGLAELRVGRVEQDRARRGSRPPRVGALAVPGQS